MSVAEIILQQLGGQRFIAMTGASHFVADDNSLRMRLPKNGSKANFLTITLDEGRDTYSMRFFYYKMGRISLKTGKTIPDVEREIAFYTSVYAEDLERLFTETTHMRTRL